MAHSCLTTMTFFPEMAVSIKSVFIPPRQLKQMGPYNKTWQPLAKTPDKSDNNYSTIFSKIYDTKNPIKFHVWVFFRKNKIQNTFNCTYAKN